MAFGDIGGVVTELIITCSTPSSGTVSIAQGDAVKLTGPYTVSNDTDAEDPFFGEALAGVSENSAPVPVKVRGVCALAYEGDAPTVDGVAGVVAAATSGKVKAPALGNGTGINLKVDAAAGRVHVLL